LKILLLSAYDSMSHKLWREGLVDHFSDLEWTVLTMPARHFSWRIRGNALYFSDCLSKQTLDFDLIIASSMVDFSTLLALKPELAAIRSIVYFHENQLAYPVSNKTKNSVEPAMVNIYAALSADQLVFNSYFNRDTFLSELQTLLRRFPDYVPKGIVETLDAKSDVVPVALSNDVEPLSSQALVHDTDGRKSLVWNHRWEYDKAPERLLAIVECLPDDLDLDISVIGQAFQREPDCMRDIYDLLKQRGRLKHWGFVPSREAYLSVLRSSTFVLSTALHDFQGLSVLEATALGCIPIVPDRLAYQEFIPQPFRYSSFLNEQDGEPREAQAAVDLILSLVDDDGIEAPPLSHLSWHQLSARWHRLLFS
jgi:glycosyltransferase involved in cell wall biosynthesis